MDKLIKIVDYVEVWVWCFGENEVFSQVIGEFVMNEFKLVDEIVYICFVSVYCQFKDVDVFFKEIELMKKEEC